LSKEVTYEQGEYMYGGKHSTDIFTETAVGFIENYDSEKPFFLYTALMTPHDPRSTHQKYFDMYDTAAISVPPNFMPQHPFDNGEMRVRDEMLAPFPRTKLVVKEHIRDYLAVGQHGLFGKQNLYEHSTKIPLIIYGKGIPPNQRSEAFVYLTDMFPTICDMLGISIPPSVDGASFYELFDHPDAIHHEYITTTYKSFQRAIRDKRFKLIKYHVNDERTTQLFDLMNDPYEMNDLSEKDEFQSDLARLNQKMSEQLTMFNDTIWTQ
jgi:arylsulfatase A-like enzyme